MVESHPIVCVVLVTVVLGVGVGVVVVSVARCVLIICCVRVDSSVFRSLGVSCFVFWVAVLCPFACAVIMVVVCDVVLLGC